MPYRSALNPTRWIHRRTQRRAAWAAWALLVAAPLAAAIVLAIVGGSSHLTASTRRRLEGVLGLPLTVSSVRIDPLSGRTVLYDVTVYADTSDIESTDATALVSAPKVEMIRNPDTGRRRLMARDARLSVAIESFTGKTDTAAGILMGVFEKVWSLRDDIESIDFANARVVLTSPRNDVTFEEVSGRIGFHDAGGLVYEARARDGSRMTGELVRVAGSYRSTMTVASSVLPLNAVTAIAHPELAGALPSPLDGELTVKIDGGIHGTLRGETDLNLAAVFDTEAGAAPEKAKPLRLVLEALTFNRRGVRSIRGRLRHRGGGGDYRLPGELLPTFRGALLHQPNRGAANEWVTFDRCGIAFGYADNWLRMKGTLGEDFAALARTGDGDSGGEVLLRIPPMGVSVEMLRLRLIAHTVTSWFSLPPASGE